MIQKITWKHSFESWSWKFSCQLHNIIFLELPVVQVALQTEKNIFELIMHLIADTDTDESSFGINFS